MHTEEKLKPEESLALIENMIATARNRFSENGQLYLLWGWTILACSLIHFTGVYFNLMEHPDRVWAFTWAALIYQTVYLAKKKRAEKVRNYTDEINGFVWITFVIMMALTGTILSYFKYWPAMYPMFMVLYGMPTFLSGVIIRFTPLKLGGFACWILAIAAVFTHWPFQLLLLSLAVVLAWIVPGYLLRFKFNKEDNAR